MKIISLQICLGYTKLLRINKWLFELILLFQLVFHFKNFLVSRTVRRLLFVIWLYTSMFATLNLSLGRFAVSLIWLNSNLLLALRMITANYLTNGAEQRLLIICLMVHSWEFICIWNSRLPLHFMISFIRLQHWYHIQIAHVDLLIYKSNVTYLVRIH